MIPTDSVPLPPSVGISQVASAWVDLDIDNSLWSGQQVQVRVTISPQETKIEEVRRSKLEGLWQDFCTFIANMWGGKPEFAVKSISWIIIPKPFTDEQKKITKTILESQETIDNLEKQLFAEGFKVILNKIENACKKTEQAAGERFQSLDSSPDRNDQIQLKTSRDQGFTTEAMGEEGQDSGKPIKTSRDQGFTTEAMGEEGQDSGKPIKTSKDQGFTTEAMGEEGQDS